MPEDAAKKGAILSLHFDCQAMKYSLPGLPRARCFFSQEGTMRSLSENARIVIAVSGLSILLGWLVVSVVAYQGGGSFGAAKGPTVMRAITSAQGPPRLTHRPQPRRAAPRKARHEVSSGAAIGTTTSGGIHGASGDSSRTGRAEGVGSGSSAPGSTDIGRSVSGGGSGSGVGTKTRPSRTSATSVNGTGTVSGTNTNTSGSGTISGTDATKGTGTASGQG